MKGGRIPARKVMKLCELIYESEYFSVSDPSDLTIEHITSEPREIREDSAFVLLPGVRFDTSRIVSFAVAKHPRVIICEALPDYPTEKIPILFVKNARRTLSFLLFRFYRLSLSDMTLIGITGTNGKTSTATMLVSILRAAGESVGFIGTGRIEIGGVRLTDDRYSMTTPDPPVLYPALHRMREAGCTSVVMEVSSHALRLEKVAPLTFDAAIFTNLSAEHLDFHRDMEDYLEAKQKLFASARLCIVNADDPYAERMTEATGGDILRVGALTEAEVTGTEIEDHGLEGISYMYRAGELCFLQRLSLPGVYNVYNSMLALSAAIALGIKPCIAKHALSSLSGIEGRMEVIRDGESTVVIDYAHTEEALRCALSTVRKSTRGRLLLLFGCGGERDRTKRPRMAESAERLADLVIVTSDNCRGEAMGDIFRDILAGFRKENHKIISDRARAIAYGIERLRAGDVLLIEGKGHERYQIDKNGTHIFDERKIIADALKKRKDGYTVTHEGQA